MQKSAIFFVMLFSGWIFSSCKKETSIENAGNANANFTAVINGVEWSAAKTSEGATLLQGMLNITGISADSEEISITLTDTTLGLHTLSPQTTSLAAYGSIDSSSGATFSTSQGTDSTQAGGEVTLTAINTLNNTVSGTFSFTVYRTSDGTQRTITSGVFTNIPYTSTLPGSAPGDTVNAIIDGATFTSQSIQASVTDAQLTILGSTSNASQSVALIVPTNATVGSHALTPSGGTPAYLAVYDFVSPSGNNTAAPASTGSVNILENNAATSRIRGSFSFTTTDGTTGNSNHTVASGYFSVYYGQ
jgi:Family of unknown function (DUF6252)